MTYGEQLTLKEAAKFAGVSEGTMRSWVKDVPGVIRVPGGGYRIPRENLQGYIAAYKSGSKAVASVASKGKAGATVKGQIEGPLEGLIEELRMENQRLRLELTDRSAELREVRLELKEAQGEVRKLEAELRAHLSGGIGKTLSRWIKGK